MELNEVAIAHPSNVNMSQELLNMEDLKILEEAPHVLQDMVKTGLRSFPHLEEGTQAFQDFNMRDLHIVEEGPRICPVCSQEIRLYFINYNEKIEMCENLECDYPFAYEPIKILREENGFQTIEVKSVTANGTRSIADSQTSSPAWSEVDRVCNAFESDDVSTVEDNRPKTTSALKKKESDRRKEELLENVAKIKQMTQSMNDMKKESKRIIKNEKWIKNLQYLQSLSGFNLLRPAEMKKIKKKTSSEGSGELKIDIDKNNLANIKIEVNRASTSNTKVV